MASSSVHFDILIHPQPGSEAKPARGGLTLNEAIEQTRRWFAARGVEAHPTRFGLSGTTAPDVLLRALGVPLRPLSGGVELPIPGELAPWVEQISVMPPPDLF